MQCRRPQFDSWVGKIHWRRDRLPIPSFLGFPCKTSTGKKICLQCGRPGFNPWVGKIPWRRKGCQLQYYGLENFTVHGVAKGRTRLSDFHFHLPLQVALLKCLLRPPPTPTPEPSILPQLSQRGCLGSIQPSLCPLDFSDVSQMPIHYVLQSSTGMCSQQS